MSDIKKKIKEVETLMDDLFDSKPKIKDGLEGVYQFPKPAIKNKIPSAQTIVENKLTSGGTIVHGDNTVIHNPNASAFKFDNSAIKAGRQKLNHRAVGEHVAPEYMTPKEYTHYLCYKFGFAVGKGWDGIETHAHIYNYEPDYNQKDFKNKDDALKYLNLYNSKAPNNIERRQKVRRSRKKDIRKEKVNRRSEKLRRQEEKINNRVYYLSIAFLFFIIILWAFVDVINLVERV